MVVVFAVDVADGAELFAILASILARDHRNGSTAVGGGELDRLASEAAGAAPHQDDVTGLELIARPAEQHAVGSGANEARGSRLLPRQMRCLWHHLVFLGHTKLV